MIKLCLISLTCFVFTSGAAVSQNYTVPLDFMFQQREAPFRDIHTKRPNFFSSQNVSLTKEEVKSLKDVAKDLKTFLRRNSEGQKSIEKVLKEYNSSLSGEIKLTKESSIEEVLLQHQLILHQEMKEMFTEFKQLILGHKSSGYAESKIGRGDSDLDIIDNLFNKSNIYIPTDWTLRPTDCSELLVSGHTKSGVYKIFPFKCRCTMPVKVFCDMDTDGGGWTVFLSRMNTSKPENFTRNWKDYKNGFGTPEKEYWIGNEVLHILTTSKNYILRMEAKDEIEREIWGEWNSFSVNSEDDKYRLLVAKYNTKSTAYDRFYYHNNSQFSTFDSDNDRSSDHCSNEIRGGWWYRDCFYINPTGIHGKNTSEGLKINPWSTADGTYGFAKWLQLKIRPTICSSPISTSQLNKHNCALN